MIHKLIPNIFYHKTYRVRHPISRDPQKGPQTAHVMTVFVTYLGVIFMRHHEPRYDRMRVRFRTMHGGTSVTVFYYFRQWFEIKWRWQLLMERNSCTCFLFFWIDFLNVLFRNKIDRLLKKLAKASVRRVKSSLTKWAEIKRIWTWFVDNFVSTINGTPVVTTSVAVYSLLRTRQAYDQSVTTLLKNFRQLHKLGAHRFILLWPEFTWYSPKNENDYAFSLIHKKCLYTEVSNVNLTKLIWKKVILNPNLFPYFHIFPGINIVFLLVHLTISPVSYNVSTVDIENELSDNLTKLSAL